MRARLGLPPLCAGVKVHVRTVASAASSNACPADWCTIASDTDPSFSMVMSTRTWTSRGFASSLVG